MWVEYKISDQWSLKKRTVPTLESARDDSWPKEPHHCTSCWNLNSQIGFPTPVIKHATFFETIWDRVGWDRFVDMYYVIFRQITCAWHCIRTRFFRATNAHLNLNLDQSLLLKPREDECKFWCSQLTFQSLAQKNFLRSYSFGDIKTASMNERAVEPMVVKVSFYIVARSLSCQRSSSFL